VAVGDPHVCQRRRKLFEKRESQCELIVKRLSQQELFA